MTLCCCVPFGIPAIVYGAQVAPKVAAGDIAGALEASQKAKMWSWIGFDLGGAAMLVYALAGVFGVLADH